VAPTSNVQFNLESVCSLNWSWTWPRVGRQGNAGLHGATQPRDARVAGNVHPLSSFPLYTLAFTMPWNQPLVTPNSRKFINNHHKSWCLSRATNEGWEDIALLPNDECSFEFQDEKYDFYLFDTPHVGDDYWWLILRINRRCINEIRLGDIYNLCQGKKWGDWEKIRLGTREELLVWRVFEGGTCQQNFRRGGPQAPTIFMVKGLEYIADF